MTKHYEFTTIEIMAIRNALDTEWHNNWKLRNSESPLAKDIKLATRALLDQFKQDVRMQQFPTNGLRNFDA